MDTEYYEKWLEGFEWYNTPPLLRKYQYCPYEWGTRESIAWHTGLSVAKSNYLNPEND